MKHAATTKLFITLDEFNIKYQLSLSEIRIIDHHYKYIS